MDATTREIVCRRADDACEYCRIPQEATPLIAFHVEHITARQHGGTDDPGQLALACDRCNAYKGPNLTSIDPDTGNIVLLFNPRRDAWNDHFRFRGGQIVGLTPIGRATVRLLNMNALRRVQLREEWMKGCDLP
ncbi:MAG TPA: HNH endonuclease signature motif containing protein [Planctomycetaceae bacterium]|nr:HNH endonuclease signature motif containing protein [Planctomycetaceae bacterium]